MPKWTQNDHQIVPIPDLAPWQMKRRFDRPISPRLMAVMVTGSASGAVSRRCDSVVNDESNDTGIDFGPHHPNRTDPDYFLVRQSGTFGTAHTVTSEQRLVHRR